MSEGFVQCFYRRKRGSNPYSQRLQDEHLKQRAIYRVLQVARRLQVAGLDRRQDPTDIMCSSVRSLSGLMLESFSFVFDVYEQRSLCRRSPSHESINTCVIRGALECLGRL